MNASKSIIAEMELLVSQMTPVITITDNVADGDNWKLSMCKTYWIIDCMEITIGGETFTVESFIANESIIVSGNAQPIGTTFQLKAPDFEHGNRRKVAGERAKKDDLTNVFVYLPRPTARENNTRDSDISYTAVIKPLFLGPYVPDRQNTDDQQEDIIEPMNRMADLFEELINDQDEIFNEPESIVREEWQDFGDPNIWGNEEKIFNQNVSGVELRLDVEVLREDVCECDGASTNVCPDVTTSFQGVDTGVKTSPGANIDFQVVDQDDLPVGNLILNNPNVKKVKVTTGGGSIDILINSVLYVAGATSKTDIPVVDTVGNPVGTVDPGVKVEIADSNISNSDDSYSVDILSETDLELPDIEVTDSDGSKYSAPAVQDIVCTPAATPSVYYNRPYLITDGVSYATYDTQWRIDNGTNDYNEAVPDGSPFQELRPDTANNRIDYLKYFNIWGHKFRFTGINGGYYDEADGLYYDKDGVLSDKATEFPVYSTTFYMIVCHLTGFMFPSDRLANKTWALYCSETPTISQGGYMDWLTISELESQVVFNQKAVNLNLRNSERPPFNFSSSILWTGTTRSASSTRAFYYSGIDGGDILNAPKTNTQRTNYIRVHLTTPVAQP